MKVSLIIPVYNAGKYLPSCLKSIDNQSFTGYEVILVDDGSTDGSWTIMKEWAQKDKRLKLFHKENEGVSSARNLGLSNATGEYICFVDADDTLPANALLDLIGRTGEGIDLVMGGYEIFDECGNKTYGISERVELMLSREEAVMQMYKPEYYSYLGYIWNKLFKRSLIEFNHLCFDNDIKFNEDRLFTVRYLACIKGNTLFFTAPVYNYFTREGSAMTSLSRSFNPAFVTDFTAFIRMKNIIVREFKSHKLKDIAYRGILSSYQNIHWRMLMSGGVDKKIHICLMIGLIFNVPLKYIMLILRSKVRTHHS